jgi:hypothetical protein
MKLFYNIENIMHKLQRADIAKLICFNKPLEAIIL